MRDRGVNVPANVNARRAAVIIVVALVLATTWVIAMLSMERGRQSVKANSNRLATEIIDVIDSTAAAAVKSVAESTRTIIDEKLGGDSVPFAGGRGE